MSVALETLDPADYRRTPWKNGGGVTVDIADAYRPGAEPGGWAGMVWRFGRTRIAEPGPFSDLSGHDRVQAVVAGRGLTLRRPDGSAIDVREPFRPVRFPGEWALVSELADGPVEVLNLIGARGEVVLDLRFADRADLVALPPGTHVVYAPAGAASIAVAGETVRLPPDGAARLTARSPVALEVATGPVAIASVTPLRAV